MNQQLIKRTEVLNVFFRIVDIMTILASGIIAHLMKFNDLAVNDKYISFTVILIFLTINAFSALNVYKGWRGMSLFSELAHVTLAWIIIILLISTLTFITKTGSEFSREWAAWTFAITYFGLITYRIIFRKIVGHLQEAGYNQKRVIIIGSGALGQRASAAMKQEAWAGLIPIAFFDDSAGQSEINGVKVEGTIHDAVAFIEKNSIPDLFGFNLANYSVDEMVGLPVMNMSAPPMSGWSAALKRSEDIFVSALALLLLSPLFAIVAIFIKKDSPGPVFFKQNRYGRDGKEILVWKFRSMTVTENSGDIKQAGRNDSRVTKIGAFLRKSSIDELPQLINVLFGSMSLVGPRPHAVAHNEFYRKKVQGYMVRHQIKPGITGWAQVNGSRGETAEVKDMEERIRYDLEYIQKWSIFLDIRIILMTFKTVANTKDTY